MNQSRIPATVVTGFLGAGKTTLIRNLIAGAEGKRIAIIVNEFGDMGFDGELLSDCGDPTCKPETVVELANGCICCTVADEFLPTMEALLQRDPAPDHIVVETSGLALPQPLVRAFSWPTVKHRVTVDGVVTVVDTPAVSEGRFAPRTPIEEDPAREHDDPVEELFEDQLRCADLLVMSKSDLVDEGVLEAVEAILDRDARPGTRRLRSSSSGLPAAVLLGLESEAEANMKGRESHHDGEHEPHDHDDFDSFVIDAPLFDTVEQARQRLEQVLGMENVLRVKGRVGVDGRSAALVVQGVGSRLETFFDPAAADKRLVVIGLAGIDPSAIRSALTA